MKSNQEIMDILDQLKEEKGFTISEIARRSGMAKSSISRYFSRERELPLNKIQTISEVFDIDAEYLLGIEPTDDSEFIKACMELNDDNKEIVHKLVDELLKKQNNN